MPGQASMDSEYTDVDKRVHCTEYSSLQYNEEQFSSIVLRNVKELAV
jgi:hypothetical protein